MTDRPDIDPTHGDDLRREGLLPPRDQHDIDRLADTVREALPVVMYRGMEVTNEPTPWGAALDELVARLMAAEARVAELRAEVDRQLGRHLCYTSEASRKGFWQAVDAALAGDGGGA